MRAVGVIVLIIVAILVYIQGNKFIDNIANKRATKKAYKEIELKADSIINVYQDSIKTLKSELDYIYLSIGRGVDKMDVIVKEVYNYKVPEKQDDIVKELKRLSK